jgi:hypothetical protein
MQLSILILLLKKFRTLTRRWFISRPDVLLLLLVMVVVVTMAVNVGRRIVHMPSN